MNEHYSSIVHQLDHGIQAVFGPGVSVVTLQLGHDNNNKDENTTIPTATRLTEDDDICIISNTNPTKQNHHRQMSHLFVAIS
jgi:hypothetical protein